MSYLTDIMEKRKNIQFFKEEAPDKKLIDTILRQAHELVPTKNNFWYYKIRVYGPEHKKEKRNLAISSVGGLRREEYPNGNKEKIKELEKAYDKWIDPERVTSHEYFFNAQVTAPYLLVYTHQEKFLTEHQEASAYSQSGQMAKIFKKKLNKKGMDWVMQASMHAISTAYLCAENDLYASFCRCYFHNEFLPNDMLRPDTKTAFMLGIGYRDNSRPYYKSFNLEALYEEIVEWK